MIALSKEISARVIWLWQSGRDTLDIAKATGIPEHEVCRILARWRG